MKLYAYCIHWQQIRNRKAESLIRSGKFTELFAMAVESLGDGICAACAAKPVYMRWTERGYVWGPAHPRAGQPIADSLGR